MKHYTTQQVEEAKKIIKEDNLKQQKLKAVKKEISEKLRGLDPDSFMFKINEKKDEVIFSIYLCGKVKVGTSKCNSTDVYNKDLGRLIAMRKAYGEGIEDLVELVEPREFNTVTLTIGGNTKMW